MVPEGWVQYRVVDVLKRVSKPVKLMADQIYQEIGIRSHGKGKFDKKPVTGMSIGGKRVFWVEPNCFVVNIVFAWEQAVARTYERDIGKIASHRFPMYAPRKGKADVDFITYFFKTPRGKYLLGVASPGGAGRNKTLGQKEFDRLPLCLPSIKEQERIAEILLTWDQCIDVTQKLVENGEKLRRALMQRLLRPQVGLESDWKESRLGDIANIYVSNVDKKSYEDESEVYLCNYTDVYHNEFITKNLEFMSATASAAQIAKFSIRKNDILITKDSETPGDIAVPALVDDEIENVICGYHLAIVRPKGEVNSMFLRSLFSLDHTRHYFFTRANGATRFGLTANAIKEAVFKFPSLEEQCHSANVIRNAEMSLQRYRIDLARLKLEKKALMQQLLMGKRRVKVDRDVDQILEDAASG